MRSKSSAIEYAISSLSEEDMNDLMRSASEEAEQSEIIAFSSQKFEVRDYDVTDVSKEGENYIAIYTKGTKPVPQSQVFDKAHIVQEGYEPTNVNVNGDEIKVTFEKTDWHMQ